MTQERSLADIIDYTFTGLPASSDGLTKRQLELLTVENDNLSGKVADLATRPNHKDFYAALGDIYADHGEVGLHYAVRARLEHFVDTLAGEGTYFGFDELAIVSMEMIRVKELWGIDTDLFATAFARAYVDHHWALSGVDGDQAVDPSKEAITGFLSSLAPLGRGVIGYTAAKRVAYLKKGIEGDFGLSVEGSEKAKEALDEIDALKGRYKMDVDIADIVRGRVVYLTTALEEHLDDTKEGCSTARRALAEIYDLNGMYELGTTPSMLSDTANTYVARSLAKAALGGMQSLSGAMDKMQYFIAQYDLNQSTLMSDASKHLPGAAP